MSTTISYKGNTIATVNNNTKTLTTAGKYLEADVILTDSSTTTLQNKSVSPTESQQTINADSGYDGLGTVTVGAISSSYVGSGITQRSSSDLTVSGDTVTAPSGYYESSASASVASGSAGTPTATKGTVSNNSVTVTPSVTNTTGWITGSTKTGTGVSVSASELVSGNLPITQNGTNIDVTNYATVSVNVSGSSTTWTTIYDNSVTVYDGEGSSNYFTISPYTTPFLDGETYRVTWDGTTTELVTMSGAFAADGYYIGNPVNRGGTDNNVNVPYCIYRGGDPTDNYVIGAVGSTTTGTHTIKIEKAVSGSGESGVSEVLLGSTPFTLTEDANVKLVGSGSFTYGYVEPFVNFNDIASEALGSRATLTDEGDYWQLVPVDSSAVWYQIAKRVTVTGLIIGDSYTITITETDDGNATAGYWDITRTDEDTTYGRINPSLNTGNSLTFTPTETSVLVWIYIGTSYQYDTLGIHVAKWADMTITHNISGSATDEVPLGELLSGTQITSSPTVSVYAIITGGGGGGSYSRTEIVPSQSVACTTAVQYGYGNYVTYTSLPVSGNKYIVTFDNNEYVVECYVPVTGYTCIGDWRIISASGNVNYEVPFAIVYDSSNSSFYMAVRTSGTHTVKVEELEFLDSGVTLIEKTITSNGTYDAEDDNADGYSSVTVSVSGGSPNLQAKTNISPTTSSQTITADNGYDGLSSVQINAMPSMTLPSSASNTSSGTSKTTITPTSSAQYLNIPTGYNGTAQYYTIAATSGGSSKNIQTVQSTDRRNNTSLGSITSLTCSKTGTYDVYWSCARSNTSQTWGSQLYIGGSSYGTENTTWTNNVQTNHLSNVSISANQTVAVYGRSRSGYYIYCPQLTIVEA